MAADKKFLSLFYHQVIQSQNQDRLIKYLLWNLKSTRSGDLQVAPSGSLKAAATKLPRRVQGYVLSLDLTLKEGITKATFNSVL